MSVNPWDLVLRRLREELDEDEYRRWFTPTAYASDSGDQITVWVPTEADRRHLTRTYLDSIHRVLETLSRPDTRVRFVVAGFGATKTKIRTPIGDSQGADYESSVTPASSAVSRLRPRVRMLS